ncbi:hypothetical protein J4440_02230 [Candidatus Woesearchaeota archaeon]|nr:hypothetical protein [Candidatus Woesearchaeota archaeon]
MIDLVFTEKTTDVNRRIVRVDLGELVLFTSRMGRKSHPLKLGVIHEVHKFDETIHKVQRGCRRGDNITINPVYMLQNQNVFGVGISYFYIIDPKCNNRNTYNVGDIDFFRMGTPEEIARTLRTEFKGYEGHATIIEKMRKPYIQL